MVSGILSVKLAGIDSLMKKKLQLYSGKFPDVQLFFINDLSDSDGADLLILPGRDLYQAGDIRRPDAPPVICCGPPGLMGLCMAAGCIDYLCTPWTAGEFFERVRRAGRLSLEVLSGCGHLSERLSPDEERVLKLFLRNRGSFFSRETLAEFIGGTDRADSRRIDMLISRLRKKISAFSAEAPGCTEAGSVIITKSGSGWGIA